MSLLIMSGVLIVGASLGTVSLLTLRQGRTIDDSVLAFGAAESGVEQTLYQLRRLGTDTADLNDNEADDSDPEFSGPPMANGSGWTRALSSGETVIYANIPRDKSYEVVLWDPENPSAGAGVESMRFSWDDDCGGTSGLEVLAAGWNPSAPGSFAPVVGIHGNSPALTFLRDPVRVVDNEFTSLLAYRVHLRAKNCDITDLQISAYSADNAESGAGILVDIPSRVSITSNGAFGVSRQAIEAKLPRLNPLTGAFDFVVFSQCSILKNVAVPSVCP